MNEHTLHFDFSCMDDSDPSSLPIDTARDKILSELRQVSDVEMLPIKETVNRVLTEDLYATMDVPMAANSAMDGYAVDSVDIPKQDTMELIVIGSSWAGRPYDSQVKPGTCVRIMTGGVLPEGADTIVMQENTQVNGDRVSIDSRTSKGENVRPRGEDFCKGDLVIEAGTCLYPAHIGLIASLGISEVKVTRKIRVAYFLTGDELSELGETLEAGNIYNSNCYTLFGMLYSPAIEIIDMGTVGDDKHAIEKILTSAATQADVVITTGGVSVGDADFVREVLEKIGQVTFWKVAMKPGRPLAFGKVGKASFFGLPGNPVSAMVTFYQVVLPALKKLSGNKNIQLPTFKVSCQSILKKRPGRIEYQRGILTRNKAGEMVVSKTGEQGSGILSSMTEANCFIILPIENDGVMAGETVEVQPFFGLM